MHLRGFAPALALVLAPALLAAGLAPVPAVAESAAKLESPAQAPAASGRFTVTGDRLVFDTEHPEAGPNGIEDGDAEALTEVLRANPGVGTIELNSGGGDYFEAFDLADVIIDFGLATHVAGRCESSCAHAFLGGTRRTLARGGRLGFHRTSWESDAAAQYYKDWRDDERWRTPFDMISWTYEDTQAEVYDRLVFMMDRGVDARFAIETLRQSSDGMWYPSRARLLAAGYLTE